MRRLIRLVTEDGKNTYVMKKKVDPEKANQRMEIKKYSRYHRKHMIHREKR